MLFTCRRIDDSSLNRSNQQASDTSEWLPTPDMHRLPVPRVYTQEAPHAHFQLAAHKGQTHIQSEESKTTPGITRWMNAGDTARDTR